MMDEGVVKFRCEWIQGPSPKEEEIQDLNRCRSKLYERGCIGVYPEGIGFGNVSVRSPRANGFIISGTQTGAIPELSPKHYTRVLDYNIDQNFIRCEGETQASSESLTHAMLYTLDAAIGAVVHVHHRVLWKRLIDQVPTTSKKISYGTPEMAREIRRLYETSDLREKHILVMGGHAEGVMTFGGDPQQATNLLLQSLPNEAV